MLNKRWLRGHLIHVCRYLKGGCWGWTRLFSVLSNRSSNWAKTDAQEFHLNMRKSLFKVQVAEHWSRLSRDVQSCSLEVFKNCLGAILGMGVLWDDPLWSLPTLPVLWLCSQTNYCNLKTIIFDCILVNTGFISCVCLTHVPLFQNFSYLSCTSITTVKATGVEKLLNYVFLKDCKKTLCFFWISKCRTCVGNFWFFLACKGMDSFDVLQ